MSLKDIWENRTDGVDDVLAEDINAIAEQAIENEKFIKDKAETSDNKVTEITDEPTDEKEYPTTEAVKKYLNEKIKQCITGEGAPTTTTEGAVGCLYMNTTNGVIYKCVAVENGTYVWKALNEVTVVDGKVYAMDGSRRIELVQAYQTYGVSIDLSNSNPETAVTYTDAAVGMVAGSPDWYKMSIFNKIKPCLFKNGAVVGYLNPDNFAQFEDGSAADITSGGAGDVMIEIPKTGYKITKSGTTLTVQITDDPNKKGFSYKAHTRANEGDREKLYIGAFLGSNKGDKLRSVSGVSPLNATGLTDFRTYAKANGAGYDLFAFYPMTLLQCLYLIMYKNLDSQTALGQGYVSDLDYKHMWKNTGATVDKGMSYGTSDQTEQMKFLGIEDFWGHRYQWIDGLVSDKYGNALVATDSFNDTGDGYTNAGKVGTAVYGYMKAPQGNNDLGFIIGTGGGSASTYFSDYAAFYGDCVPVFGGCFYGDASAGAFRLYVDCRPSSGIGSAAFGGRLMFL